MMIIESTSLVQTHANRYNIFIAKDLLPLLFKNKIFTWMPVFFWNSVILSMWDTVTWHFDFNWINSWSLFTDFQNAYLFFSSINKFQNKSITIGPL